MQATPVEIPTLAQNIVLVASYWMSFVFARDPKAPQDDKTLARGAFHVISLAAPYLEPHERELFNQLAKHYIA
jgi:Bacterial transcriptional repressor